MSPTALIFGITGQDGSYLAELLLQKGYFVHGVIRRSSNFNTQRIEHIFSKLHLHYGDITDALSVADVIREVRPQEIYNLAAQSHVAVSFECPAYTLQCTAGGALNIFEAVRTHSPDSRVYQASSSEQFGNQPAPQSERTAFDPCSPYAAAKVYAHHLAEHYRHAHCLFIACGILFNHESERRGETFVTRKITRAVTRIKAGLQDKIVLGNLRSVRDWGYAPEYVEAIYKMMQLTVPMTLVLGTGQTHSVQDFYSRACAIADIDPARYLHYSPDYTRPDEVHWLEANSHQARQVLDWHPRVLFPELIERMMAHDACLAMQEARLEHTT